VTIPAATLARWKQEATEGTKTAAARLAEVCACLASLTPDSRRDFDALGAIFWSLAEQLRQGTDRADILNGYEFARAQLFDLIDRTQTANQARAVREANRESSESKAEAPSSFAESGTRKPTGSDPDRRAA
jgi:plasmid stabilization system protein ParE